jgi:cardiolipin synthase
MHFPGDVPPKIVGPKGMLSKQESEAVMDRLKRQVNATDILERHVALMEAVTGSPLIAGNRATLLCDGPDTFSAMTKAIRNAKDHINLETFIFRDDEVGRPLVDLLLEKQAEGVNVNVIYDSFGALRTPADFFERMRAGGINVLEFNPVGPLDLMGKWKINNRDHRKILVVDGRIAFTGGVNFYRVYAGSSSEVVFDKDDGLQYYWRDTHIQIEGPAVAELQKLFLDMWKSQSGPALPKGKYFPELEKEGNSIVQVVASTPQEPNRSIYTMYMSAIMNAQKSIHIANAYLVPGNRMLKSLADAAQRGVDVKIILPSSSDFWMVFYAGRFNYSYLLKSGVKLYELHGAVLHSKTAVIDGVWSTVGSSNLDSRSFLHDAEVNVVILGRDFADAMEAMFGSDLAGSQEILPEEWEERPYRDRIKEWTAQLFRYWL